MLEDALARTLEPIIERAVERALAKRLDGAGLSAVHPGYVSISGAKALTGFSRTTLREAIKAKELPVSGKGRRQRIRVDALLAWVEARTEANPPKESQDVASVASAILAKGRGR